MTTGARLCLPALALVMALAVSGARAETLYVIDQLVVSVNNAPEGAGERVATLKSGERVELLDRQGDEAQVRLANGTEGWVKGSYLSAEQPLQRRLQDRTAEVDKLRQDVGRLEAQLAAARTAAATPSPKSPAAARAAAGPAAAAATPAPVTEPATAASPEPAGAGERDSSLFTTAPDPASRPAWVWVLCSSALALAVGFVTGWRMLDRRIRRKYGGLRIY